MTAFSSNMNLNLVMSTVTRKEDERVRTGDIYIHCYKLLTEAEYIYIYIYIYMYIYIGCLFSPAKSCHESDGETPQFLYFDFLRFHGIFEELFF